jgi:hypothetical protein
LSRQRTLTHSTPAVTDAATLAAAAAGDADASFEGTGAFLWTVLVSDNVATGVCT